VTARRRDYFGSILTPDIDFFVMGQIGFINIDGVGAQTKQLIIIHQLHTGYPVHVGLNDKIHTITMI